MYSLEYENDKSGLSIDLDDWSYADGQNQELDRELLGFNIYRDNGFIASVGPDVYTYMDLGLENGTEYCYYLIAE